MAYSINQECTSCGDCESHCPVDAISEGPVIYVIDSGLCNDCQGYSRTPLCKKYCPVPDCIQRIEE
ncbi:4Fe-4S binding protein [candidate division KSB1 bacterium]|nr:4Fe-4S binding protein [candidate division KSB1 bacterium]MBL7093584.1 4Fe-4S binding protein [candidate division KSB1 bacterium]